MMHMHAQLTSKQPSTAARVQGRPECGPLLQQVAVLLQVGSSRMGITPDAGAAAAAALCRRDLGATAVHAEHAEALAQALQRHQPTV